MEDSKILQLERSQGGPITPDAADTLIIWDTSAGLTTTTKASNFLGGGGLASLVSDTMPQLGGDLDLNSHVITGMEIDVDIDAWGERTAAGVLVFPDVPITFFYTVGGALDYIRTTTTYSGTYWRLRMVYNVEGNASSMVSSDDDGVEAATHFWTKTFTYDVDDITLLSEGAWL
jgi:hypothetical protein